VRTSDPEIYRSWLQEVKERHDRAAEKYPLYEYVPCPGSDTLLIAFGITSRIVSALKSRFSLFRPIRIFPVLEKELQEITGPYRRIIVIEGSDGQFAGLVQCAICREVMRVACLGGGFKLRWIESQIEERLKEKGH
jgi:2-oxoglutarate ferredoxin oxidoreductase subunit alpha